MMVYWTEVRRSWVAVVCGVGARAGERLRSPATSHSSAVKCGAAGRQSLQTWSCRSIFMNWFLPGSIMTQRGGNDLSRSLKPTHCCAHYDQVLPVTTQPHSLSALITAEASLCLNGLSSVGYCPDIHQAFPFLPCVEHVVRVSTHVHLHQYAMTQPLSCWDVGASSLLICNKPQDVPFNHSMDIILWTGEAGDGFSAHDKQL